MFYIQYSLCAQITGVQTQSSRHIWGRNQNPWSQYCGNCMCLGSQYILRVCTILCMVNTCVCITHTHTYAYTHTCTHTRTHAHTHTHTRTCTHTHTTPHIFQCLFISLSRLNPADSHLLQYINLQAIPSDPLYLMASVHLTTNTIYLDYLYMT